MADGKLIHGAGGDTETCRSLVNQLAVHSGRIAESEASGNANTVLQINQPVQFQSSNAKSVNESIHTPASAVTHKGNRPEKEHHVTNTELDVSNQPIDGQIESNHICNKEDYINSEENCKSRVAQVIQSTQSHQSNYSSTALQFKLVNERQCIHDCLENKQQEEAISHHIKNQNDSKTILEPRLACHESCNNCKTASNNHTAQLPEQLSQICAKGVSHSETSNEKMAAEERIHGGTGGDRGTCRSLVNQLAVLHNGRIADSEASGNGNTSPQINQSVQFQSNNEKFVNESTYEPASAVPDKDDRTEKEHNGYK
ncbi:uncharacterized protein [Ptychodera flava]|uniref:uncharacterized protein isoform X1 n=1 Tax=Ptychodera flava TaxID=63121 RepID=UPI00396A9932